jgi:hypothetical protein
VFEDRVRAFCKDYETGMDPNWLVQFFRMSFVSSGPTSLVLLALDQDGLVVGHCFVIAEMFAGHPVITITQLQVDHGTYLTQEEWAAAEAAVMAFAAYHKAETVNIAARSRAAARLFRRRGFTGEWVLMKRSVSPAGA